MLKLLEARTISVSIARSPAEVYAFVADPVNLPRWASGLGTSVEVVQGELIARTAQGQVKLRFAGRNDLGVLDHYVSPAPGVEIYVPMRAVANGAGSELVITLFRQPGMSDATFQKDADWVLRDLFALKAVLEGMPET